MYLWILLPAASSIYITLGYLHCLQPTGNSLVPRRKLGNGISTHASQLFSILVRKSFYSHSDVITATVFCQPSPIGVQSLLPFDLDHFSLKHKCSTLFYGTHDQVIKPDMASETTTTQGSSRESKLQPHNFTYVATPHSYTDTYQFWHVLMISCFNQIYKVNFEFVTSTMQ